MQSFILPAADGGVLLALCTPCAEKIVPQAESTTEYGLVECGHCRITHIPGQWWLHRPPRAPFRPLAPPLNPPREA